MKWLSKEELCLSENNIFHSTYTVAELLCSDFLCIIDLNWRVMLFIFDVPSGTYQD